MISRSNRYERWDGSQEPFGRDAEDLFDRLAEFALLLPIFVLVCMGIFDLGRRNGWCASNPCDLVDKPRLERNVDIRFLDQPELDALLQAVRPDTPYGPSDRAVILTAAMTGLRQGELLALRWGDIDWTASRVRVRRSYVRGEWGAPKSRRSSRSVPLADRVARELELHFHIR